MNSPRDVSLYELALSSEQPSHALQISPTVFKSMISTTLDLLIEHNLSATLWMKLPRGRAWQLEIDRYQAVAGSNAIYRLSTLKEDAESLGVAPKSGAMVEDRAAPMVEDRAVPIVADEQIISLESPANLGTTPVLSIETRLRREYFLLVLSAEFNCLVLAHRPRSPRNRPELMESVEMPAVSLSKPHPLTDEEERKHPLLGLCSFDFQTIERILEGMGQAIDLSESASEIKTAAQVALSQSRPVSRSLNPLLLSDFFSRQIQRQEEVWHSSAIYRKQAETVGSLQLENEELLNAVQLKDEFLKNVGQELRTPLTTMKTALSLLNSSTIKPPQRQRYMEMLSRECDRQSSLITSVLDLVQLENVTEHTPMQPLRLSDVVPGVVSTYQPLAQEKGIMLAYTVPEELPAVSCLSPWLRQIVINLLHNGIKFTPTGGKVWVKAKQQGDFVEIEFRDTGIGIAAAEIPKIFDRFYRSRTTSTEKTGGAGLGLSIVQQLLLRCGGSVSVKSRQAEGTIFSVMLPVYR